MTGTIVKAILALTHLHREGVRNKRSWSVLGLYKAPAVAHPVVSEAVRPQFMVGGGLMLGLMVYVSPISPASWVWLGLPGRVVLRGSLDIGYTTSWQPAYGTVVEHTAPAAHSWATLLLW